MPRNSGGSSPTMIIIMMKTLRLTKEQVNEPQVSILFFLRHFNVSVFRTPFTPTHFDTITYIVVSAQLKIIDAAYAYSHSTSHECHIFLQLTWISHVLSSMLSAHRSHSHPNTYFWKWINHPYAFAIQTIWSDLIIFVDAMWVRQNSIYKCDIVKRLHILRCACECVCVYSKSNQIVLFLFSYRHAYTHTLARGHFKSIQLKNR